MLALRAHADITGARALVKLGGSVITDHISPAGAIPAHIPAGSYPRELGWPRSPTTRTRPGVATTRS